ncbi:MAG: TonB-dependent receptor, partial [Gammaproteobacteria bacterium]|nr:TonB-dependent receptor [Gammaproteobacteria bacterium]
MRNVTPALLMATLIAPAHPATADEAGVEEVLVTGSYIKGSPIDAPSPIEIIDRAEIEARGNPSVMDMVQRLGPVTGADGRTDPFQGENPSGTANVNLRGLGPERTLVLLNGLRVASTAEQYVNINAIPASALERVELLKDGASATYGSDAIAGVANFITRSDFRGIEFTGAIRDMDATDGTPWEAGLIAGLGTDRLDLVASFGYTFVSRIPNREKDWVLQPASVNVAGGFSPYGNPVTLLPFNTSSLTPDPDCETVGGVLDHPSPLPRCFFRFTDFFSLQEEEEHYQFFLESNFTLTDTLAVHGEGLFARDDVPALLLSPTFPAQSFFGNDRVVVPGMPHFDDFIARNPQLAADMSSGALVQGRVLGVSGPASKGLSKTDTYRVSAGVSWDLNDRLSVRSDAVYTRVELESSAFDTRIDHLAWAYRGLGGPDCDVSSGVPGSGNLGSGDCYYYNPFTSGFRFSQAAGFEGVPAPGSDNPQLNNPEWLNDWLKDPQGAKVTTEMLVLDIVATGNTNFELGGGYLDYAAGFQYRKDQYNRKPNEFTDNTRSPCAFGLDAIGDTFFIPPTVLPSGGVVLPWQYECNGAGPFHFVAAASPFKSDQDVTSVFGELALPLTEKLDIQLALRYEDYGAQHGDTLDPKIAARWDLSDGLSLRASYSSAFRAPPVSRLGGLNTRYQFIGSELSFVPVDIAGNPDLKPEQADTYNVGVIWQPMDSL